VTVHPPFAAPGSRQNVPRRAHVESLPSIQEFLDELPSIDDFIDHSTIELPPIADFVVDGHAGAEPAGQHHDSDWFEQEAYDAEGWAVAGWQDFDWTRAASLGVRSQAEDEANSAWDTLDWSAPVVRSTPSGERRGDAPPSADEVARALDGIARRIRSGELVIDQLSGTPPEAAMAAALAALLRMRD
jgi:hypothetical protein